MKITEIWLRNNATPTSFSRGEDYIDEVWNLTKRDNTYTAFVEGSDTYEVTIETNAFDADCFCSCPYDWGGICKHIVAVGLKIIEDGLDKDNDVNEISSVFVSSTPDTENNEVHIEDNEFYESIFLKTDETIREEFLKQMFLKDSSLRAQFNHFISNNQYEVILADVDDIAKELRDDLNNLRFNATELYSRVRRSNNNQNYYEDDDDDLSEVAIEIISEAIEPFSKQANNFLKTGNILDATRIIMGMYEATFGLKTPKFFDYHYFDDLSEEAQNIFQSCLIDLGETCQQIIKNEDAVRQAIDLIIQRWKFFYQEETKNEWGIEYDFHAFEAYFVGLVTSVGAGEYLLSLLDDYERYSFHTSNLYLHLAKVIEDEDLELKILEDFSNSSVLLSKKLLHLYFDQQLTDDFYRVARQAFSIFPNYLDKFLLEKINPEIDEELYIDVLRYFTKERNNIEGYKKLKEYWTPKQIEDFIEQNRLNASFYVQMLEVEERYEEILQVVKTNKDSWGFDKLTLPILNIYPDQMLDIYFERAYRAMGPGAQDRRKYRQVAKNLKPVLQIEQLSDKRKGLIKQLKNKYRYLPAFMDELAKAGF